MVLDSRGPGCPWLSTLLSPTESAQWRRAESVTRLTLPAPKPNEQPIGTETFPLTRPGKERSALLLLRFRLVYMLVTYYYYSVGESKNHRELRTSLLAPSLLHLRPRERKKERKKKNTPRSEAVSNKRRSQPAEEPALPGAPIRELQALNPTLS